jgi:hypothetical protein
MKKWINMNIDSCKSWILYNALLEYEQTLRVKENSLNEEWFKVDSPLKGV